jgi:hypothetical protein
MGIFFGAFRRHFFSLLAELFFAGHNCQQPVYTFPRCDGGPVDEPSDNSAVVDTYLPL